MLTVQGIPPLGGIKQWCSGEMSYFVAKCVNISKTAEDTSNVLFMKLHMRFQLTLKSMTLDDLELHKFEFSVNFSGFRRFRTKQPKQMRIDQYCQRQCCKHVELQQFLACFRVARICQR